VIAAILDSEPQPMATVRPRASSSTFGTDQRTLPLIERVVRRCLTKGQEERWQTAAELLDALQQIRADTSSRRAARRTTDWRLIGGLSAAVALILVASAVPMIRHGMSSSVTRLGVRTLPTRDLTSIALAPDGRHLVFTGASDGVNRLWLRELNQPTSRLLPGTEGAYAPFWSPDSSEIGFFAVGKLRRIDVVSGYVQVIADAPTGRGGTWNLDGVVVFAPIATAGLMQVAAAGGTPTPLVDGALGRGTPRWPQFLPDGRRFLFYIAASDRPDIRGVYVGSLDGAPSRRIIDAFGSATFVPPHWLMFEQYGSLRAQRFDPVRATVSGDLIHVANDVAYDSGVLRGSFAASATGVLAYRTSDRHDRSDLVWRARDGRLLGKLASLEGLPPAPALSPDGQRVALARRVQGSDNIWIFEAKGGTPLRLTSDPLGSNAQVISERNPIWSPDGGRIVFASARKRGNGTTDLYERATQGGGDRLVLETPEIEYAQSRSRAIAPNAVPPR
jgi:Tol biopolymer transport system component